MSSKSRKNNLIFTLTNKLDISLSLQTIDLGNVSAGETLIGSKYGPLSIGGDTLAFTEINLVYSLSDSFIEFETLLEWVVDSVVNNDSMFETETAELIYLDGNNKPYLKYTFYGLRPTDIENPDFDVNTDATHELSASFHYDTFKYENLKTGKVIDYGR